MDIILIGAVVVVLAVVVVAMGRVKARERREKRARFIVAYAFPAELKRRLQIQRPELTLDQLALVLDGLKQYFLACLSAQRGGIARSLGMPSKAVDEAWREFTLMTKDYEAFCQEAFGTYLPHMPQEPAAEAADNGLANTLHQLKSAPLTPVAWATLGAVPLLFAIDRQLGLADGRQYDEPALAVLEDRRQLLLASTDSGASHSGGGGDSGYWSSDSSGGGGSDGGGGGGDGGGGA